MKSFCTAFLHDYRFSFLFFFIFSLSIDYTQAQTAIATAKQYLRDNAQKQKLVESDINEMTISSAYLSPTTGWYHVYFNQNYQSIEVYNSMINMVLQQNQVQHIVGNFIPNIASKANVNNFQSLSLSPLQALQKATTHLKLTASDVSKIKEVSTVKLLNGTVKKASFSDVQLSDENIEVKLYWLPVEIKEGEKTISNAKLSWSVKLLTKNKQNSWSVHVDALSGDILRQNDEVIHCNFGTPNHSKITHICSDEVITTETKKILVANNYNVFDIPLESPNHGVRTLVNSPYTRFVPSGTGPGATNGWHNDGTVEYNTTRGNNVYAKEDVANSNGTGASPTSPILEFDHPYTFGINTATDNQNAAITNLFYWNNLIHDILWKYGFDEPSGNFQNNNQGRGGAGNDFIYADAQDGGGTNNANFLTPADGGNGRIQMYLWSNAGTTPYQPDGDFDNGIIAHEYGHGWSIRLTGGPANSSCLQNGEQGGEGWSDYVALMFGTNWISLTPSLVSANIPRGIGTYALGQPITGSGIRPFRYSYDKANINNVVTYAKVGDSNFSQPHGIGSIWATMLWDMTWEIIFQDNQIVGNIYTTPTNIVDMKGNVAALKLVNEGLRLQPCSPSFVDARNAILSADQMLFGGRYRCAISRAFSRRGLGLNASTGASSNDRIVVEDFTPIAGNGLSSSTNLSTCSGKPFVYSATSATSGTTFAWTRPAVAGINNVAKSENNAFVTDTLINTTMSPIAVTYYFTLSPDLCGGVSIPQAVSVIVNPTLIPTISNYTVCQNRTIPLGQGLVVPQAISNTVSGNLTSVSPVFNRPNISNPFYYKAYNFVAPSTETAIFEVKNAVLSDGTDTYMYLYQTSFDPLSPTTNLIAADDDGGVGFYSLISQSLTQGVTYILVFTTFSSGSTGVFSLQSNLSIFSGVNSWYKNAVGGVTLTTGQVFNPVGLADSGIPNTATLGTTTFYVENSNFSGCRTPVIFNINATIVSPNTVSGSLSGSLSNNCAGKNTGIITLLGHLGPVLSWESSANNFITKTSIPNNTASLTYSNLSQTTQYKAIIQTNSCLIGQSNLGTILVTPSPTITSNTYTNPITCGGEGSIAFNSTNLPNGIYPLNYSGTGSSQNITVSNNTFNLNGLVAGVYSSFTVTNLGCDGIDNSTKTLSNPLPTGILNQNICYKTRASLSGSCMDGVVKWYDNSEAILKGLGSPFLTDSLMMNTTFKVRCQTATCQSNFISVKVMVNPEIVVPTVQRDTTIFVGESISLNATGCSSVGTSLNWYKTSSDSFVIMPFLPSNTTNYYTKCEQVSGLTCSSNKSSNVTVSVFNTVTSIRTGDWNSPSTWNIGRIPIIGIAVIIDSNHTITINGEQNAKSIEYKGTGNIVFNPVNGKLKIGI